MKQASSRVLAARVRVGSVSSKQDHHRTVPSTGPINPSDSRPPFKHATITTAALFARSRRYLSPSVGPWNPCDGLEFGAVRRTKASRARAPPARWQARIGDGEGPMPPPRPLSPPGGLHFEGWIDRWGPPLLAACRSNGGGGVELRYRSIERSRDVAPGPIEQHTTHNPNRTKPLQQRASQQPVSIHNTRWRRGSSCLGPRPWGPAGSGPRNPGGTQASTRPCFDWT